MAPRCNAAYIAAGSSPSKYPGLKCAYHVIRDRSRTRVGNVQLTIFADRNKGFVGYGEFVILRRRNLESPEVFVIGRVPRLEMSPQSVTK